MCTANNKLEEDFNMGATHIILASSDLSHKDASNMIDEINDLDGVAVALGKDAILGTCGSTGNASGGCQGYAG